MRKKSNGFTLIELLIAMVVSGLVLLAASQAFKLGLANTQKGADKFEENLREQGIINQVWKQLSSLYPYNLNSKTIFFKGSHEQMMFVSPFSLIDHYRRGFMVVFYTVTPGGQNDLCLTCWENPLRGEEYLEKLWQKEDFCPSKNDTRKIPLFEKCQRASFEYLDAGSAEGEEQNWIKEWKKDHLPRAIRIEIARADDSMVILIPVAATS